MNRYYASAIGRFTTPDPYQSGKPDDPQSWNRYSYVLNDPVNLNDPTGLKAEGPQRTTCIVNGTLAPEAVCRVLYGDHAPTSGSGGSPTTALET